MATPTGTQLNVVNRISLFSPLSQLQERNDITKIAEGSKFKKVRDMKELEISQQANATIEKNSENENFNSKESYNIYLNQPSPLLLPLKLDIQASSSSQRSSIYSQMKTDHLIKSDHHSDESLRIIEQSPKLQHQTDSYIRQDTIEEDKETSFVLDGRIKKVSQLDPLQLESVIKITKDQKMHSNLQQNQKDQLLQKKVGKYLKIKKMLCILSTTKNSLSKDLKKSKRNCNSLDHFFIYSIKENPVDQLQKQLIQQKSSKFKNPKLKIIQDDHYVAICKTPKTPNGISSPSSSTKKRDSFLLNRVKTQEKEESPDKAKEKSLFKQIQTKIMSNSKQTKDKNQRGNSQKGKEEKKFLLRRKSCYCGQCGTQTRYEIKQQNIVPPIIKKYSRSKLNRVFKIVNFLNRVNKEANKITSSYQYEEKESSQANKLVNSPQLNATQSYKELINLNKLSNKNHIFNEVPSFDLIENEKGNQQEIADSSSEKQRQSSEIKFLSHAPTEKNIKAINGVSTQEIALPFQSQRAIHSRTKKSMTFCGGKSLTINTGKSMLVSYLKKSPEQKNEDSIDKNENKSDCSFELVDQSKHLNFSPTKPKTMILDIDQTEEQNEATKVGRNSFLFFVENKIKEAKRKRQAEQVKYVGKTPLSLLLKLLSKDKIDSVFSKDSSERRLRNIINTTTPIGKKRNYLSVDQNKERGNILHDQETSPFFLSNSNKIKQMNKKHYLDLREKNFILREEPKRPHSLDCNKKLSSNSNSFKLNQNISNSQQGSLHSGNSQILLKSPTLTNYQKESTSISFNPSCSSRIMHQTSQRTFNNISSTLTTPLQAKRQFVKNNNQNSVYIKGGFLTNRENSQKGNRTEQASSSKNEDQELPQQKLANLNGIKYRHKYMDSSNKSNPKITPYLQQIFTSHHQKLPENQIKQIISLKPPQTLKSSLSGNGISIPSIAIEEKKVIKD